MVFRNNAVKETSHMHARARTYAHTHILSPTHTVMHKIPSPLLFFIILYPKKGEKYADIIFAWQDVLQSETKQGRLTMFTRGDSERERGHIFDMSAQGQYSLFVIVWTFLVAIFSFIMLSENTCESESFSFS